MNFKRCFGVKFGVIFWDRSFEAASLVSWKFRQARKLPLAHIHALVSSTLMTVAP